MIKIICFTICILAGTIQSQKGNHMWENITFVERSTTQVCASSLCLKTGDHINVVKAFLSVTSRRLNYSCYRTGREAPREMYEKFSTYGMRREWMNSLTTRYQKCAYPNYPPRIHTEVFGANPLRDSQAE